MVLLQKLKSFLSGVFDFPLEPEVTQKDSPPKPLAPSRAANGELTQHFHSFEEFASAFNARTASPSAQPTRRIKQISKSKKEIYRIVSPFEVRPTPRIDLHGYNIPQAIQATLDLLNQSITEGHNECLIIHGKGSGRVRKAVHDLLKNQVAVKWFGYDGLNYGITRVRF